MRKTVSKSDVGVELWNSFVSLLKSYAAVAGLPGVSHGLLVLDENSVQLISATSTLRFHYHPMIGRGVWSLHRGTDRHAGAEQPEELERGIFVVNLDGTIAIDGDTVEIDFAAIQLIALLTHAASHDEIEVPA